MSAPAAFTAGPWHQGIHPNEDWRADGPGSHQSTHILAGAKGDPPVAMVVGPWPANGSMDANARLIAASPDQNTALNYVADMTYCGADGEWHFKMGYDPQRVLDALAKACGESR